MEAQRITYNFISGLGFPLTCSMKEDVDSFSISESFSFEMNTGWLDASRSWRSAADTEMRFTISFKFSHKLESL